MALFEKDLIIKTSTIPDAGKGLFTKAFIPKGVYIVEYTGSVRIGEGLKLIHWQNKYVLYVNRNHAIDASKHKKSFARYVNDAKGFVQDKSRRNNAMFINDNDRIYIQAKKDILPGSEILVGYGKQYWDVLKHNAL